MVETWIGLGLVALFGLAGWALLTEPESLIRSGMALAAVGFAYGIPTAIVYHGLLYRALTRCHRLPRRWWLSPTSHHARLPADDRRSVLAWGAVGGSGFVVVLLGIGMTTLGLWRLLAA